MKWFLYALFGIGIAVGWMIFMGSGEKEAEELEKEIFRIEQEGSLEELDEIPAIREKIESVRNEKSLTGIMLAFVTAGLVGIVFVIDVLPLIAHKFTHAVYDSGEEVGEDPMREARAKLAQGDYEGAIAAFRDAAEADPLNRVPWVEIAKVQRDHLHDPQSAVATMREAIEAHDWQGNDAAFLMFRLAELYHDDIGDQESAVVTMKQVIESFPETRHSANARHRLQEWGVV